MPLNLLVDPWLPVRRLSGSKGHVRPADIASNFNVDPILALDFPRPDWNAAVTEFLIGLLAVVMPPEETDDWAEFWGSPPSPDQLQHKLQPLTSAFNLDGDGPRAFQDLDPLAECDDKPITALLIDAPGENSEKKNTDLFVKRAGAVSISLGDAAAALITMQTYAPAGGQGNRTSLRGGGPLTTLAMPRRVIGARKNVTTLWDLVWSNVPDTTRMSKIPIAPDDPARSLVFPWLAATRTSENDRSTACEDNAHVLQQFFGMPRRIRLNIEGDSVRTFKQKNFGVKYVGFIHPLSPHRLDKKSGLLPYHPQPGGATYRDWLTWVEKVPDNISQRAACLDAWEKRLDVIRDRSGFGDVYDDAELWQSHVFAFGYDMDNMKARGWLEARIPFFDVPPWGDPAAWPQFFHQMARKLVAGTDEAANTLRYQIKIALAGKLNKEGHYRPGESLPKNAFSEIQERLWREMEGEFRKALVALRGTKDAHGDPQDAAPHPVRGVFLDALRRRTLAIFDEVSGTEDLIVKDARRIVAARTTLLRAFGETGKVRQALDLATEEAKQKKKAGKSKRKENA